MNFNDIVELQPEVVDIMESVATFSSTPPDDHSVSQSSSLKSAKSQKRTLSDYYQHQPPNKKRKLVQDDDHCKESAELIDTPNCMDISNLKGIEYKLKDNATILYYERFLEESRVQSLWKELLALNYQQGEFKMFGKVVKTPRMQSSMRDEGITRKMGSLYQTQDGHPWSQSMLYIKNTIEKLLDCKFQFVLINHYRDGNDYIGWHSDREARPKHKNVVASVSLGGPRRFIMRHRDWKKKQIPKKEFMLPSGCLLVMKDDTQKMWKHTVPKSTKLQNPRINLTFRQVCDCTSCTK